MIRFFLWFFGCFAIGLFVVLLQSPLSTPGVVGTGSIQKAIAYLLLCASFVPAAVLSHRVPQFLPISKLRAGIGLVLFYALAAFPAAFTVSAANSGLIVLGSRRVNPNPEFSVLYEPLAYWFTYSVYLFFCVCFLAVAIKYTRHALGIFRPRA